MFVYAPCNAHADRPESRFHLEEDKIIWAVGDTGHEDERVLYVYSAHGKPRWKG